MGLGPCHVAADARPPGEMIKFDQPPLQGQCTAMLIAQSKVTAQGEISVPAEVRKKLGIGPGSVLEWEQQNDQVVVRRAGQFTSTDIHKALFGSGKPKSKRSMDVKEGIRKYIRKRRTRS
jgi:AbrB family looped-hinge helix DNA binding protein